VKLEPRLRLVEMVERAVYLQAKTQLLPRNTSLLGRVLRGAVAVTLISLGSYGLATGELDTPTGGVLLSVSLLPAAVGATGYCPLTDALGISEGF
jgi:hypothetical protein